MTTLEKIFEPYGLFKPLVKAIDVNQIDIDSFTPLLECELGQELLADVKCHIKKMAQHFVEWAGVDNDILSADDRSLFNKMLRHFFYVAFNIS